MLEPGDLVEITSGTRNGHFVEIIRKPDCCEVPGWMVKVNDTENLVWYKEESLKKIGSRQWELTEMFDYPLDIHLGDKVISKTLDGLKQHIKPMVDYRVVRLNDIYTDEFKKLPSH